MKNILFTITIISFIATTIDTQANTAKDPNPNPKTEKKAKELPFFVGEYESCNVGAHATHLRCKAGWTCFPMNYYNFPDFDGHSVLRVYPTGTCIPANDNQYLLEGRLAHNRLKLGFCHYNTKDRLNADLDCLGDHACVDLQPSYKRQAGGREYRVCVDLKSLKKLAKIGVVHLKLTGELVDQMNEAAREMEQREKKESK